MTACLLKKVICDYRRKHNKIRAHFNNQGGRRPPEFKL
nr:MAG TPA: hypothetical protein [Caudoviricetes sp.]